jgi:predicted heme/steroid binding protein/uncharacterized membrane protein
MEEPDPLTLSAFDGKEGRPAYVVHRGRIFNVTASRLWRNGLHMNRHAAGQDLTAALAAAPHGPEVLNRYPQVGVLQAKTQSPAPGTGTLARLFTRFPMLRRHPHPSLVHFPIAFGIAPALFYLLFLLNGLPSFETTAFHCLTAGLLAAVPGILTGFLTWWLNYEAKPLRAVRIKIRFTVLFLGALLAAFGLRLSAPAAVAAFAWPGKLYLALLLAAIPLLTVVGWFGASLTFPMEKR